MLSRKGDGDGWGGNDRVRWLINLVWAIWELVGGMDRGLRLRTADLVS